MFHQTWRHNAIVNYKYLTENDHADVVFMSWYWTKVPV